MVKSLSNDCFGKIPGGKPQVVEVVVHETLLERVAWKFRRTRSGLVYSVIPKMSILRKYYDLEKNAHVTGLKSNLQCIAFRTATMEGHVYCKDAPHLNFQHQSSGSRSTIGHPVNQYYEFAMIKDLKIDCKSRLTKTLHPDRRSVYSTQKQLIDQ